MTSGLEAAYTAHSRGALSFTHHVVLGASVETVEEDVNRVRVVVW
jgi:hypothetical protein